MRKIKKMLSDSQYLKVCLYVSLTAVALFITYRIIQNIEPIWGWICGVIGGIFSALSPLFIGLVIAYLLSPVVKIVQAKLLSKLAKPLSDNPLKAEKQVKRRRIVSVLITFVVIVAILFVAIYFLASLIVGKLVLTDLESTVAGIVSYFQQYQQALIDITAKLQGSGLEGKVQEVVDGLINWFSDMLDQSHIVDSIMSLGGSIFNFFLGIIVAVYLLADQEFFTRLWRKTVHVIMPMKAGGILNEVLADINNVISKFLRGQLLDGLIVGILSSIGLTIVGLDFAILIGAFAGIANIIPYFGPILGMIPAAIVGFLTGGFTQAIFAILILFIIQQIDSAVISPRVVGSSTGLHPLFVLLSVTVGGYYGGILGMLIAVPIAGIVKLMIIKWVGLTDESSKELKSDGKNDNEKELKSDQTNGNE